MKRSEPTPTPSVGTKLEGLLMDEFEEDFNPRAYETAANGLTNHQSSHNSLLNGQVSSNSNFFSQSNGTTSPPPLCKLISSYFLQSSLVILHYAKGRTLLEAISVSRSPLILFILFIFVPSLCHFAARRSFILHFSIDLPVYNFGWRPNCNGPKTALTQASCNYE